MKLPYFDPARPLPRVYRSGFTRAYLILVGAYLGAGGVLYIVLTR